MKIGVILTQTKECLVLLELEETREGPSPTGFGGSTVPRIPWF